METWSRRRFLETSALAGSSCIAMGCSGSGSTAVAQTVPPSTPPTAVRRLPAQTTWSAAPTQSAAMEGVAALPGGARLWYWDTGGSGDPVVLVHAATGSGASWEYQQPALAGAGHRVIGYSMRGKYRSDPLDPLYPGTASGDLHELIQFLGLNRFHLVGTAAGGGVALDYAASHSAQLLSLVIANTLGGVVDDAYRATIGLLLPPQFSSLPADFRELGPSYRADYRPGVTRWLELVTLAGQTNSSQPYANRMTWATLEALRVPTLVLTGDADLYMPPANLREFVRHLPGCEAAVFSEAGHSAYWEQPAAFNQELSRFFAAHRA